MGSAPALGVPPPRDQPCRKVPQLLVVPSRSAPLALAEPSERSSPHPVFLPEFLLSEASDQNTHPYPSSECRNDNQKLTATAFHQNPSSKCRRYRKFDVSSVCPWSLLLLIFTGRLTFVFPAFIRGAAWTMGVGALGRPGLKSLREYSIDTLFELGKTLPVLKCDISKFTGDAWRGMRQKLSCIPPPTRS